MNDNVVPLRGNSLPLKDGVNTELVDVLEKLLADAKSGQLIAMAQVLVFADKNSRTGWQNGYDTQDIVGNGILTLMHRYGQACVG